MEEYSKNIIKKYRVLLCAPSARLYLKRGALLRLLFLFSPLRSLSLSNTSLLCQYSFFCCAGTILGVFLQGAPGQPLY